MNTTTIPAPTEATAETLRRAADLTDMIGHPIDYYCPKGFTRSGYILRKVSISPTGHIKIQSTAPDESLCRVSICSACRVSVVMDLGTVDA